MTEIVRDAPTFSNFIRSGTTPKIVREFIREVMGFELIQRAFEMGMGRTLHPTPVVIMGGKDSPPRVEMHDLPAPAAVQAAIMGKLLDKAVPGMKPQEHDEGARRPGVFVLPALVGLDEVRRRAEQRRIAEHGFDPMQMRGGGGYVPPPGLEVVVVEENFARAGPAPPSAATARSTTPPKPTPAQEIAARRRARKGKPAKKR